MSKNESEEYETYHDINISELDIPFLQEQVTKIVAGVFALIVTVHEIREYLSNHPIEGEHSQ